MGRIENPFKPGDSGVRERQETGHLFTGYKVDSSADDRSSKEKSATQDLVDKGVLPGVKLSGDTGDKPSGKPDGGGAPGPKPEDGNRGDSGKSQQDGKPGRPEIPGQGGKPGLH